MKIRYGHRFYGFAAVVTGVITLASHRIQSLGNISHPDILVYTVGIFELVGGLAMQWQRTARFGTLLFGAVFLVFTLHWIPYIVDRPLVYAYWGNFFEYFSVIVGGAMFFASTFRGESEWGETITNVAYRCFGVCSVSFALYQLFYLQGTAELIPTWIPPGQMFWAVATTVAFGLAAVAVLTGRSAVLATRLVVTMLLCFCPLVWLPLILNEPHEWSHWARNAVTLVVAGAVWIVADHLSDQETVPPWWSGLSSRS